MESVEPQIAEWRAGERAVVLVHPCHWDATLGAKLAREYARMPRRAFAVIRARAA